MSELRVAGIYRFPVKSMQGEGLAAGVLTEHGLPGDRRWGVIDEATGRVLSAKLEPRLMQATAFTDGEIVRIRLPEGEVVVPGREADEALSAWLGRPLRLGNAAEEAGRFEMHVDNVDDASPIIELPCPPGTYYDAATVHLLTTASVRAMQQREGGSAWNVRRFRPTLLVEAAGDGFVEDEWIGSTVQAGSAELMVFAPTVRCRMTVHEQPGLARDLGIIKAVNREHGGNLGVYAVVRTPGRVAVGDAVTAG
jgi:uncharacterized protein YcbX